MKFQLMVINQLFEMQHKLKNDPAAAKLERNFKRIFSELEEAGFQLLDPIGEKYSELRTDYEANIVGNASGKLVISEVIKPIIYFREEEGMKLVQKGIVVAEK